MADLVEKNREADRRLGVGGFDPADDGAVAISDLPRAAGHIAAPALEPHAVLVFDTLDQRSEVTHFPAPIGEP
jgi:hypothetical protein